MVPLQHKTFIFFKRCEIYRLNIYNKRHKMGGPSCIKKSNGSFTNIGVSKKGINVPRLFEGYFLQLAFTWNKIEFKKSNSPR